MASGLRAMVRCANANAEVRPVWTALGDGEVNKIFGIVVNKLASLQNFYAPCVDSLAMVMAR
jgi:hypothetical protein